MIPGVPYDAEIEYIQTSGTQYIDTGIPAASPLVSEVKFRWLDGNIGKDKYILAMSGSTRFYFGTYQSYWMFGFYSYSQAAGIEANKDYVATCRWETPTAKLYIDGELKASINWSSEISNNGNLLICNRSTGGAGGTQWKALARIYHCEIYQGSLLVRDFIPVRVGTDGCLYDRVSRKLFRNQGTGSFVVGPDVAVPVMGLHFMRRPRYTAKDYVQAGLVAMWDGIENAGWGVHDASPSSIVDLCGRYDFSIGNRVSVGENSFSPNTTYSAGYMSISGFPYKSLIVSNDLTIDACVSIDGSSTHTLVTDGDNCRLYCASSSSSDGFQWAQIMGGLTNVSSYVSSRSPFTVSFRVGGDGSAYFIDGQKKTSCSVGTRTPADGFSIGINTSGLMKIHRFSVYHAISDSDIAHNHAVDKERFNLP